MDDYYNLGRYSRSIQSNSPEAQIWFDRGLNWTYGYHHEEAIECFKLAIELDPDCLMAHCLLSKINLKKLLRFTKPILVWTTR